MSFRIDPGFSSLSAGAAIIAMLEVDPEPAGVPLEDVPLFRNPIAGHEVTYNESRHRLDALLQASGNEALASGLHSLRIGGATALANDPAGGDFVAGCGGLWTSDCRLCYFYAIRERLEAASYSAGRRQGGSLAVRPGPLSAY